MTKLTTDQDYIDFLTREYGWKIESPAYTVLPTPHEKYIPQMGSLVAMIQQYVLNTYVIQDRFDENHSERRRFLAELGKQHPNVLAWVDEHNKLRVNRISVAVEAISLLHDNLREGHRQLYEALQPESAGIFDGRKYGKMPFAEKVAAVRKIDDAAYKFLEGLVK